MKTLVLTTAFLVGTLIPLMGTTNPNPVAQESFLTAEQQADLFHDPIGPFELEVDFTAQLIAPTQGHLTLRWEAKDRWWSKVVLGGFEQIKIQNGETQYTSRNLGFTPVRIGELNNLIRFAGNPEAFIARSRKQHVKDGVEMTCLQVQRKSLMSEMHEVCVNTASHDLLSDEWQQPMNEWHRQLFSDYLEFQGHRYPRKLELRTNDNRLITANVISLKTAAFDEALLVAPKGAIVRRQCANLKPAVAIHHRGPMYSGFAILGGSVGETDIAMTILTDGSVGDVQLMSRGDRSVDDALLKSIKSWKFKPAMCGADPVVSDIQMFVRIRP